MSEPAPLNPTPSAASRRPVRANRRRAPVVRRGVSAPFHALALEPAIDADKLAHLIAADERRQSIEAARAFAVDFAAMAGELPVVDERGEIRLGDRVLSTYALWEDLNEAVRPVLQRWGFALTFAVQSSEVGVKVSATLLHRSGHVQSTSLVLPPDVGGDRNRIQAVGSALSYAKRYTATALLNLTSRGEDDDARLAGETLSSTQLSALEAELVRTSANRIRFLEYLAVPNLAGLPAERFEEAMAALRVRDQEKAA